MASKLVKILKAANQPIPDFFGTGGNTNSFAGNQSNEFRTSNPQAHGGDGDDDEW